MMNFFKGYDWVLLGTVFVGTLAALYIAHKAKLAMDKRAMKAAKEVAS